MVTLHVSYQQAFRHRDIHWKISYIIAYIILCSIKRIYRNNLCTSSSAVQKYISISRCSWLLFVFMGLAWFLHVKVGAPMFSVLGPYVYLICVCVCLSVCASTVVRLRLGSAKVDAWPVLEDHGIRLRTRERRQGVRHRCGDSFWGRRRRRRQLSCKVS